MASLEALSAQVRSRRSLVRALEKLVWHQQTFVRAAGCLLRLALAENESWADNATGQWKSLFGARLPTTSADPETRISYLASCVQSPDASIRRLAVQSANDALAPFESVMVSGELQGGAVVALRGSVRPGNEALRYWSSLVGFLDDASMDEDEQVSAVGRDGLVAAIHPFLEVPEVGERLTAALLRQDEALRRKIRSTVDHHSELADRPSDQVSDDREYSAVVMFLRVLDHRLEALPEELQGGVFALLAERASYPNMGTVRSSWCRLAVATARVHPEEMVRLIFDLVSEGHHILHESDDEALVVGAAATSAPEATWSLALERIDGGDWRLSMALRGWFPRYVPVDVVRSWVGDSLERARLAASIAPATSVVKATEEDEDDQGVPSDLAIYLLDSFGDDDEVAGALAGEFQSGSWMGPWSGRIAKQISDLTRWRRDMQLPVGLRTWAGRMIEGLERQRADALEREAEEHR